MNAAVATTLADPAVVDRLSALGNDPRPCSPDAFKARLVVDVELCQPGQGHRRDRAVLNYVDNAPGCQSVSALSQTKGERAILGKPADVKLQLELVAEEAAGAVHEIHIERQRLGRRRVDHALELRPDAEARAARRHEVVRVLGQEPTRSSSQAQMQSTDVCSEQALRLALGGESLADFMAYCSARQVAERPMASRRWEECQTQTRGRSGRGTDSSHTPQEKDQMKECLEGEETGASPPVNPRG